MVLAYTFFKSYIFKIYNGFSLYIHIYTYIYILVFAPNNSLVTKIKNLDGHMAENWIPIEI